MNDQERLLAHMMNGRTEFVMCAAIWYDDGEKHEFQPYNIESGYVVCGWRHPNCFSTYRAIKQEKGKITFKELNKMHGVQGFLTTKNRFLNRAEALELVQHTGQLSKPLIGGVLTSEDLW